MFEVFRKIWLICTKKFCIYGVRSNGILYGRFGLEVNLNKYNSKSLNLNSSIDHKVATPRDVNILY